jgi:iron complex transport system substrate-binding protein
MTPDCCNSPGKGNIGDYITFVGGHNIGADVLPGAAGRVSVEYIVSQNPEVYIATGGPHLEKTGGLVLGPGYSVDRARAALRKMTERPGISLIPAVKAGRVYGLAHQLLNSPLDILAVEALARWIHPDLFRDVDPDRTLAEMNRRFLVVPLDGVQWIALR